MLEKILKYIPGLRDALTLSELFIYSFCWGVALRWNETAGIGRL